MAVLGSKKITLVVILSVLTLSIVVLAVTLAPPSRAEAQDDWVSYVRSVPPLPTSRIASMTDGQIVAMGVRICGGMKREGYSSFADAREASPAMPSLAPDMDEMSEAVDNLCASM